jgi:hypothetical protein
MRPLSRSSFNRLAALSGAALLAGCATGANPDGMVPPVVGFDAASPLHGAIAVTSVEGGSPTDPMWMSRVGNPELEVALQTALRNEGLLANDPAHAPYRLSMTLVEIEKPWIGFTFDVGSTARYVLTPPQGGPTLLDETVATKGSASMGDSLLANDRLRLASESAIRANIAEFVARLKAHPPIGATPAS